MKRLIFPAALLVAILGVAASAQQPAPATTAPSADAQQTPAPIEREHTPNPRHEAKHLAKALNLTPDQESKLEPILADRDQKITALKANTSLDPKDLHRQMKAIHEATEQQLSTVLTPDQMQQMKSMHHGPHGNNQNEQAPPATPPSA